MAPRPLGGTPAGGTPAGRPGSVPAMPAPQRPPLPADIVDRFNAIRGGFNTTLGLRFVRIDYAEIIAELEVTPALHQPYGLVHGGVYAAMVETLASVGAAVNLGVDGLHTVGLENSTSFLRAVREGRLRGRAVPLTRGRKTHVWEVEIHDRDARLVATGRVRTLTIAADASLAGAPVQITAGEG